MEWNGMTLFFGAIFKWIPFEVDISIHSISWHSFVSAVKIWRHFECNNGVRYTPSVRQRSERLLGSAVVLINLNLMSLSNWRVAAAVQNAMPWRLHFMHLQLKWLLSEACSSVLAPKGSGCEPCPRSISSVLIETLSEWVWVSVWEVSRHWWSMVDGSIDRSARSLSH